MAGGKVEHIKDQAKELTTLYDKLYNEFENHDAINEIVDEGQMEQMYPSEKSTILGWISLIGQSSSENTKLSVKKLELKLMRPEGKKSEKRETFSSKRIFSQNCWVRKITSFGWTDSPKSQLSCQKPQVITRWL